MDSKVWDVETENNPSHQARLDVFSAILLADEIMIVTGGDSDEKEHMKIFDAKTGKSSQFSKDTQVGVLPDLTPMLSDMEFTVTLNFIAPSMTIEYHNVFDTESLMTG